ncbi:MAG: hypothetical protein JO204_17445 [Alphaproteobacteria bacterium]|nr:hypothetical protein [Alphaproteobacteria bacterium]
MEAALARAYQLRSFEIEHYWKRGTYFWGFQIAIFAAFGLIWKAESNLGGEWTALTIPLASLGILTALANSLSARGSRFWQENWEKHIDMLESAIEGRLYKTVWLDHGRRSYSVSRVNRFLSDYFVVFWIIAFLYAIWRIVRTRFRDVQISGLETVFSYRWMIYLLAMLALTMLGAVLLFQRSDLHGTNPNEDGSHGKPIKWSRKASSVKFMRRYEPDEPQNMGRSD